MTPTTSRIARNLGQIALSDADGAQTPLRDLWAERPVVLVFIRHFG